ncbi:MAG: hypothetical protein MMC33_001625 [Icmadophila ericetorum]|nr:hypothetical protein [Icmadophila ericetorum]
MKGGPSIIGRSATEKSNTELTNSLRANFLASHQACSLESEDQTLAINGSKSNGLLELDPPKWTSREPGVIYVPAVDFSASGLVEERSQYDITVKLFFLPSTKISARSAHTGEAIFLVLKELHVKSIDLLIVSFAGITFDADDDEDEEVDNNSGQESENLDDIMQTWKTMEQLHAAGTVSQIGLAEFGSERLKKFLPRTKVRPSVDQINVRDCCVVPKSLILYAKQEKIELLTHNDCTNILPKGTVRELLSGGQAGARLLADPVTGSQGLQGEVEPQWVVKYTAVVRDRGVIENKGYFAMAKING